MQKEFRELTELGLSENEATVYQTLLQLGSGTARDIATQAGLNRSTTYVQLTSLQSYGLASSFLVNKKTHFAAESPENLKRLIDQRIDHLLEDKRTLTDRLPELMQQFMAGSHRPTVRIFEGVEGLRSMRAELLESGVDTVYVASDLDALYALFSREELMAYSEQRREKGIKSYVLYTKSGRAAKEVPPQEMRRVDREQFPFEADIYIYGDTVSIATVSGTIVGVTVKNAALAHAMRSLFQLAWTGVLVE